MEQKVDIAVVGAGPVGLAAALAAAAAGYETCLVGPAAERRDGRTAALMVPAVELLRSFGIWPALASTAGALRSLRIVDDTGSLFRPPPVTFRAAEIGLEAFGWNVENAALVEALAAELQRQAVPWRTSLVADYEVDEEARLRLADGTVLRARLVIAADGRRSRIREAAGIAARQHRYPQAAFTTLLRHERPHGDVSTEFHRRAGPFTLVPLPGLRSSLVWVTQPRHAERLLAASDAELAAAVESGSHSILGRVEPDGPRGLVPLAAISVASMTGPRLALAGEAGHVLPPIGAQGLNLGMADVAELGRLLREAGGADPGAAPLLARYGRARETEVRLRSLGVDGLNRSLLAGFAPLDAVRGLGLGLLGGIGPLRRAAMRAGFAGRSPFSRPEPRGEARRS
ncbi:FAD-dependent monooxygenase [Enterovirga sp.]|uniref:FAD-dependent monooxygenase n=1 Tax=Enterovirga sp. TaxID=2026350 RepID=UPI002620A31A|nr:FAD-dependent monooxygenase [Enterovirga sp.]